MVHRKWVDTYDDDLPPMDLEGHGETFTASWEVSIDEGSFETICEGLGLPSDGYDEGTAAPAGARLYEEEGAMVVEYRSADARLDRLESLYRRTTGADDDEGLPGGKDLVAPGHPVAKLAEKHTSID